MEREWRRWFRLRIHNDRIADLGEDDRVARGSASEVPLEDTADLIAIGTEWRPVIMVVLLVVIVFLSVFVLVAVFGKAAPDDPFVKQADEPLEFSRFEGACECCSMRRH